MKPTLKHCPALVLPFLASPVCAQITTVTAPPLPVPGLPPWALLMLALLSAALFLRSLRTETARRVLALSGATVLALLVWQAPELRAQLLLAFTQPKGETLEIPVLPTLSGNIVVDFDHVLYQNDTKIRLMIEGVTPPSYVECFPSPLAAPLPAGAPLQSSASACEPELVLRPGVSCVFDVATACRNALAANQALITIAPSNALILASEPTRAFTVTNSPESPKAAEDLALDIPDDVEASQDCGPSLAPGASCTITVTMSLEKESRELRVQGSNTYPQTASVSAEKINLSIDPPASTIEAFDGRATFTVTHAGNLPNAAEGVALQAPAGINSINHCPSSLAAGESCTIEVFTDGAGGPDALSVSGSNTYPATAELTATEWTPGSGISPQQFDTLSALLAGPVDGTTSQCNPFAALPFSGNLLNLLPSALLGAIPATSASSNEAGFEVRTCGNFTLMVQLELQQVVRALLLIEGDIQPTYAGLLAQFDQSTLTDTIIYSVVPGFEADSLAPSNLPAVLAAAVTRSYGGSLSLKAGEHITGRVTLRGVMADVLGAMHYPSQDVVLTTGRQLPPIAWQTAADAQAGAEGGDPFTDGLKPTLYVELAHDGIWAQSAGIQGLTLVDTTVYYDEDNSFGFWGVGDFNSNPVAMFYNGPLKFSKDPLDYLGAQVGFGARDITLGDYLAFKAAYQGRYANLAGGAAPTGDPTDTFYSALFAGLGALPLDLVAVTNSRIAALNFKSGDPFPALDNFNLVGLGPTATFRDGTNGPLFKIRGDAELLNQSFGSLDFTASASGASGAASGDIGISLPTVGGFSLGSFGAGAALSISASFSDPLNRSMRLSGSLAAPPIGGGSFGVTFDANQLRFAIPSSCTAPMNLAAAATLSPPLSGLSPGSLSWAPSVSLPDPADLLSCAADIYVLIENGIAYVFKAGEQLMQFGADLLPENEVTAIGLEGLKFAGGALTAAPAEILNVAMNIPGAAVAVAAAREVTRLAEEAAAAAAAAAIAAVSAGVQLVTNAVSGAFGSAASFIADLSNQIINSISNFLGGGRSSPDEFGFQLRSACTPNGTSCTDSVARVKDLSIGHKARCNLARNLWAVEVSTGKPLAFEGVGAAGVWKLRDAGLPAGVRLVRIDADPLFGAVAVAENGETWVARNLGNWQKAPGYAVDVGIGGGVCTNSPDPLPAAHIWKISSEAGPGGYRVYRAPYTGNGQTDFAWQAAGNLHALRIDVGGDGRAWAIQDNYQIWEWTGTSWEDRAFTAVDLTVSQTNRAWFIGFDYNAAGGRFWIFNPPNILGVPRWEILDNGFRGRVIAAGDGIDVCMAEPDPLARVWCGIGR